MVSGSGCPPHGALACVAMALLAAAVAVRMFRSRVAEMREKRINPQKLANSIGIQANLQDVQAADNFRNLLEAPVLFYALCALLIATGKASLLFAAGAWIYVALRVAHSVIHCGYNRVMQRFYAYAASGAVLLKMWIGYGAVLLAA